MPNPADLPGFYFDPEKNRYFPVKGPIPGVSKRSSLPNHRKEPFKPNQTCHVDNPHGRKRRKVSELLQVRELHGRFVTLNDRRNNFEQEYQKLQASHPMAWKYQKTDCIADSSLEQFHVIIQTRDGQKETNLLAMGSMNGTLSLYEVGKVGQQFDYGFNCLPKPVWPLSSEYNTGCSTRSIWSSTEASECFSSSISCITRVGNNCSADSADDSSSFQNGLVTTLGSGESGGSIYILNLTEPLDFCSDASDFRRVAMKIVSFDCTIWTAACNSNGTDATIGTNLGAAVINLETGGLSWVYRSKSDILSQQLDQSGKVVLCGLRDGSIVAVDIRQRPLGSLSSCPPGHQIPSTPRIHRRDKKSNKQRLELKGHSSQSNVVYMPSAVCSLVSLRSDDQYFLGSSMDGTIKLFDLRLLQRGGVQSYEGHVNSHTRLQLGVDPSETLVMSGGEDCCVRIWSIKTSELLFGDEISNSVVQTICCPQIRNVPYGTRCTRCYDENLYEMEHCWGAWLGSRDGLFYMHGT